MSTEGGIIACRRCRRQRNLTSRTCSINVGCAGAKRAADINHAVEAARLYDALGVNNVGTIRDAWFDDADGPQWPDPPQVIYIYIYTDKATR